MSTPVPITAQEWRAMEQQAFTALECARDAGATLTIDRMYRLDVFTHELQPIPDSPLTLSISFPEPKPAALFPEDV